MGIPTTGVSQLFSGVVLALLIASTLAMILLGVSCFYEAKAEGFGEKRKYQGTSESTGDLVGVRKALSSADYWNCRFAWSCYSYAQSRRITSLSGKCFPLSSAYVQTGSSSNQLHAQAQLWKQSGGLLPAMRGSGT